MPALPDRFIALDQSSSCVRVAKGQGGGRRSYEMASALPSAKELMQRAAQKEGEKAAEARRLQAKAEAEKQALIERLQKPSGVSDEEALRRVKVIIDRAV